MSFRAINGILCVSECWNSGRDYQVSSKSSEEMMDLLKELAMLKEMDEKHETAAGSDVDTAELESRKKRRHEICEQIKALGGLIG
jgi:hypothetical protein